MTTNSAEALPEFLPLPERGELGQTSHSNEKDGAWQQCYSEAQVRAAILADRVTRTVAAGKSVVEDARFSELLNVAQYARAEIISLGGVWGSVAKSDAADAALISYIDSLLAAHAHRAWCAEVNNDGAKELLAYDDPTSPPQAEPVSTAGAVDNPYTIGLPAENWRRGYNCERFLGYANSPAEGFYKEGKAARAAAATPPAVTAPDMSDEQIDAIWQALPGLQIHNEAASKGVDTQYALRIAFARALRSQPKGEAQ